MSCPLNKEALDKLKKFVDICVENPSLLSLPDLAFFKNFIESFGGKIPSPATSSKMPTNDSPSEAPPQPEADEESGVESDLELENTEYLERDEISPDQKMGNLDKEVTEEDSDKSDEKRGEAVRQLSEGNLEAAIKFYTEAIELNPASGLLFAKRGQIYLKLDRPCACIKDCTRALELNPDSAAGYKFRGRAYRLLGEWEKAAKDLRQACNIDLDEQIDEWLKEVTPNALKIEQHNLKVERKRIEKEQKERLERARKAREAHEKAQNSSEPAEDEPQVGGGGPGLPNDFMNILQDPELRAAFSDPEVSAAFADISSNPTNLYKYHSNPKVAALITKLSGKLAGAGVGPGSFSGFPGFPGFGGAAPGTGAGATAPPSQFEQDDNLD